MSRIPLKKFRDGLVTIPKNGVQLYGSRDRREVRRRCSYHSPTFPHGGMRDGDYATRIYIPQDYPGGGQMPNYF